MAEEEKVEQQEETAAEAAEEATEEAAEEKAEDAAPEAEAAEEVAAAEAEAPAAEAAAEPESAPEAADSEAAPEAEATETAAEPEPEAAAEPAAAEAEPAAAPQEELTYEVLHKKTVAELRDIAQGIEHDALKGYSTMHKEHLVPALCTALGIEAHVHHEVVGINKDRVKAKIRALKVERKSALEAGDHAQLKLVRRRIKSLKRKIRRATV